jgi:D-methionine transport system ATP-binding protein
LTKLRVEQIAYGLPYRSLLQPLSFSLNAGETVVLTGASSSGKSLLLRLLNRLVEPTGGRVYLDDRDYCTIPVRELRRQILLVGERPQLLGMTVQDALLYPLKLQKLTAAVVEQRVIDLLSQWPIAEAWLTKTADQLTPRECQIVAIGRGLIAAPQVLLVDAPSQLEPALIDRLRTIAQGRSMAILMAGRDLVGDRYLYLQVGELQWERSQIDWETLGSEMSQLEAANNWD